MAHPQTPHECPPVISHLLSSLVISAEETRTLLNGRSENVVDLFGQRSQSAIPTCGRAPLAALTPLQPFLPHPFGSLRSVLPALAYAARARTTAELYSARLADLGTPHLHVSMANTAMANTASEIGRSTTCSIDRASESRSHAPEPRLPCVPGKRRIRLFQFPKTSFSFSIVSWGPGPGHRPSPRCAPVRGDGRSANLSTAREQCRIQPAGPARLAVEICMVGQPGRKHCAFDCAARQQWQNACLPDSVRGCCGCQRVSQQRAVS